MPGLVIDGAQVLVPGVKVTSWFDRPDYRLKGDDERTRNPVTWIRGIVLHTTKGIPGGHDLRPQKILSGFGPASDDGGIVGRSWSTDQRNAGAHLVVDRDGDVACLADLRREAAYHAGNLNEITISVEIYQGADAELYEGQLDVVVRLVDRLTLLFSIQRQFHRPYRKGPIARLEVGGKDVVGVYGHRDASANRGAGDPGDAVFARLAAAGYEAFDFAAEKDKVTWRSRQAGLGIAAPDGIPGPQTVKALKAAGRVGGLWVRRPGDEPPKSILVA